MIQGEIIQEQGEDINKIGKLYTEVHDLVIEQAKVVDAADPKLDEIKKNAEITKDETAFANKEIAKGAEYQKKSYKSM